MPGPAPHDCDAEDALVGDMLMLPHVIADVAAEVVPGDFFQPHAAAAFAAIVQAHNNGEPLGPSSLLGVLREAGADPDPAWIMRVQTLSDGSWKRHAKTVVAYRVRRQLVALARSAATDAKDPTVEPGFVLDQLRAGLGSVHLPDGTPPAGLHDLDTFMDRPDHEQAPWIVPSMLRQGWRVVIVGGEGGGKSTLWRQFAIRIAQGLHPVDAIRIEPVRTLLVDLENPADAIAQGCVPIRTQVKRETSYQPGRAWLWHRPQGVNLRSRTHQAELAAVLAATRPQVVSLGPLYKAYHRDGRETDEQAVAEVQRVFDDLRTRFGFALLLEHHAPQESAGLRTMRPYGSSLWLRWPEVGLGMQDDPERKGSVKLVEWRGARMECSWPDRLDRGTVWPWVGHWDNPNRRINP